MASFYGWGSTLYRASTRRQFNRLLPQLQIQRFEGPTLIICLAKLWVPTSFQGSQEYNTVSIDQVSGSKLYITRY